MLQKNPKPATRRWIKRGATILFVGEAIAFAVSYAIWYRVNTRRDFRQYLHENYPSLLEIYYKVGETVDSDCKVREIDYAYWNSEKHQLMAERLIKSAFWLAGCTALGYGLLITTTQSEADINQIRKELPGVENHPAEALKKKQQFVDVLQSATASNQPLYRLNKEGIDKELKKQLVVTSKMEVMEGDKISALTKRDLERKLDLQKRKQDKNNLTADNEKLSYFENTFMTKKAQIENLLSNSQELDKKVLPDHFNTISKEILLLQKYVASSNIFLRSYDIKKCQEALQELTNNSKELEEELLPKKKFGFKNKTKPKLKHDKDEVDFQKKTFITKQLCGFSDKNGENLVMKGDEICKKDVSAENLQNCTIRFLGYPSTLHLNHLTNCYVFTGPVSTSIFAENCVNCTLIIACQQLRLHGSKNVNIYLHVTSRAIMEDCNGIRLAPYNFHYNGLEDDFKESGLDKSTNNWTCVDDFNWLNVEKQSPNWSLLQEEDLVKNWDNIK